jgi:hypothetical protein
MNKKQVLRTAFVSVLLFSAVAGTQVVKVTKTNFLLPFPSPPPPLIISIQSPIGGGRYLQDSVSLAFTVKIPSYPGYDFVYPHGDMQSITYSLDGQSREYIDTVPEISREQQYSVIVKELSEGWHNIMVTASCEHLSKGSALVIFLVDAVPPKISVLSPQNKTYPVTDVPLNFNLSELAKWIGYSLDGQTNLTITGNTTLPELSDGSHSLTVYANDTVGRFGTSETIYFSVDTVLPRISFLSPQNKTYYKANITLSFTLEEAVSWIAYSLDGQENVTIKGNVTLTGLSNSSHSLTVYAKDTAGNTGTSETIYFSITQQEPFPTLIAATTVIVAIAVIGAALLIYFVKARKARGKTE